MGSETTIWHLSRRNTTVFQVVFLVLMIVIVFAQIRHHAFLNFDDDLYISQNHQVQSGLTTQGVIWAFTTFHASNWHPLTWLSHMLDCELFGLNSGWHHLMNLSFHLTNTLLLYFLTRYLFATSWSAFLIAALFGIHPLHVESVAWASERKDLLCTLFGFAAIFFYCGYSKSRNVKFYLLSLLSFCLSLLSKPMLVTLPFLLLLLDFWPLQRFSRGKLRLIYEKIPFLLLSLASGIITILAQKQGGAMASTAIRPIVDRFENASLSLVSYLFKTIWPTKLAVFYPFRSHIPSWQTAAALLILVVITYTCLQYRRKRPAILMGWLWYLITLIPVLGIIQVGEQAMADRYSYIPLLGIFFMLSPSQDRGSDSPPCRWEKIIFILICLTLAPLTIVARQQTGFWHNQYTLFKHTVAITENNYVAYFHLGNALVATGDMRGALEQFAASLEIEETAKAHNNLAYVLERQDKLKAAIKQYRLAITLEPNNEESLFNLGIILLKNWQAAESIPFFQRALQLNPANIKTKDNLQRAMRLAQASKSRKAKSLPNNL